MENMFSEKSIDDIINELKAQVESEYEQARNAYGKKSENKSKAEADLDMIGRVLDNDEIIAASLQNFAEEEVVQKAESSEVVSQEEETQDMEPVSQETGGTLVEEKGKVEPDIAEEEDLDELLKVLSECLEEIDPDKKEGQEMPEESIAESGLKEESAEGSLKEESSESSLKDAYIEKEEEANPWEELDEDDILVSIPEKVAEPMEAIIPAEKAEETMEAIVPAAEKAEETMEAIVPVAEKAEETMEAIVPAADITGEEKMEALVSVAERKNPGSQTTADEKADSIFGFGDSFFAQLDEMRNKAMTLHTSMKNLSAESENLKKVIEEREEKLESLERQIADRENKLEELNAMFDKMKTELVEKQVAAVENSMSEYVNKMMASFSFGMKTLKQDMVDEVEKIRKGE